MEVEGQQNPHANNRRWPVLCLGFCLVAILGVGLGFLIYIVTSSPVVSLTSASISPLSTTTPSTWNFTLKVSNTSPLSSLAYHDFKLSIYYTQDKDNHVFLSKSELEDFHQKRMEKTLVSPSFILNLASVDKGVAGNIVNEQAKRSCEGVRFQLKGTYLMRVSSHQWIEEEFKCKFEVGFGLVSHLPTKCRFRSF